MSLLDEAREALELGRSQQWCVPNRNIFDRALARLSEVEGEDDEDRRRRTCGQHPKLGDVRQMGSQACGRMLQVVDLYRCGDCGTAFCRDCLRRHFQTPETREAEQFLADVAEGKRILLAKAAKAEPAPQPAATSEGGREALCRCCGGTSFEDRGDCVVCLTCRLRQ